MSRSRSSLSSTVGLAATAAATTWVAMLSWQGFAVVSSDYLVPLVVLGLVIAGSGVLLRWWRVPGLAVLGAQLVLGAMVASAYIAGSPIPVGDAGRELVLAIEDAVRSAKTFAAPVPRQAPSIGPLLIAGGLVCLLLVDLLACTLRRVPLAGLPLLTVYSVPVSMLGSGLSWWVFTLTAAGFMTMLFLHEFEQLRRWGRPLGADPGLADPSAFGLRTGAIRASAGTIGGVATALAVFVPLLIPTLNFAVFDLGRGPGGNGDIEIENPMTDLRRDLIRGKDVPLIQVTTRDPDPGYLRISVLNRFSENEWSSGDREVPTNQVPNGPMPPIQGVASATNSTEYDYQVSVNENFKSTWLPTQFPVSRIQAPGDWRYDTSTYDFLASDDDLDTAELEYSMTFVDYELDAIALARAEASASLVSSDFTDLPTGLSPEVRNLANEVTREAPSRYEKAVALQQWFREVGGFEYSLNSVEGNGADELAAFLRDDEAGRVGYCEQFASAMAVMARILGIPARVAVGFLEPKRIGSNQYVYSAHDLHAWPELFFEGAGWVRFEPTPSSRASNVPSYTEQNVPEVINPTSSASGGPDAIDQLPSESASAAPAEPQDKAADQSGDGTSIPWVRLAAVGGGLIVIVTVLLLPRLLRRAQRERRLAAGPEGAWAELQATALDLRVPWPQARSPRETRSQLVQFFGAPPDDFTPQRPARGPDQAPDAIVAIERIVLALELLRYSRGRTANPDSSLDGRATITLRAEVSTITEALGHGVGPKSRRVAGWWPRSVFRRAVPVRAVAAPEPEDARTGGVVEHVG